MNPGTTAKSCSPWGVFGCTVEVLEQECSFCVSPPIPLLLVTNGFVIAELALDYFELLIDRNLWYVHIFQCSAELSELAVKELACLDYCEPSSAPLSRNWFPAKPRGP